MSRPIEREDGIALFCLPCAGYGLNQFDRWPTSVGETKIHALRYPGDLDPRWWRDNATFEAQAADLIDDLGRLFVGRFAFFGHCSSALVAYEAAAELVSRGMAGPTRLIVSGSKAPQHARVHAPMPTDDEITEQAMVACLEMGSNPLPSLVASNVRALRAEASACRTYQVGVPRRLSCPITAISWSQHPDVDRSAMRGWRQCAPTSFVTLNGSKYRYTQAPPELMDVIESP